MRDGGRAGWEREGKAGKGAEDGGGVAYLMVY